MRIQFWHIVVLLLVVLLLFGSSRLPDLARSIGKSMKILKSEVGELRDEKPTDHPQHRGANGDEPGPRDR